MNWEQVTQDLNTEGYAVVDRILSVKEAREVSNLYNRDDLFRNRVVMERHRFGRGEYKYFKYPLRDIVASLRAPVYPQLVPIANHWNELLGIKARYPTEHSDYIEIGRASCRERV